MNRMQFEALLADAEGRLSRLRMLYDQWLVGTERLEPLKERDTLENVLRQMRDVQPANTALRFRFNQLSQRYLTYSTHWRKVSRQIEDGSFRRDRKRSKARREPIQSESDSDAAPSLKVQTPDGPQAPTEGASHLAIPTASGSAASKPSAARRGPPPVPPPPLGTDAGRSPAVDPPCPAAPPSTLSDDQVRAIYKRYIDARARNQEPVEHVRIEALARNLHSAVSKLATKHAGRRIDFDVVLHQGRVALKPVVR